MNKKITTLVTVGIVLLIGVLLLINRSTHFFGYADDSQSALIRSVNLNQSSYVASGSGEGGASGSGQGDSGSGAGVCPNTNTRELNSIQISSLFELNNLMRLSSFNNARYRDNFYSAVKESLDYGNRAIIYLDKGYRPSENLGRYQCNGYYINDQVSIEGKTCARDISVKSYFVVKKPTVSAVSTSSTPYLDELQERQGGVCEVTSAVESINFTLKLIPPAGFPNIATTSTSTPPKTYWNTAYLEKIVRTLIYLQDLGYDFDMIYQLYIKNFLKKYFTLDEARWKELLALFNQGEVDCTLHTVGHSSHIRKIYEDKDGNKVIEISNNLNQGTNIKHTDIPLDPGTTTIKIDKKGVITFEGEGVKWWRNKGLRLQNIMCIYLNLK